ncbi:hypothetical protein VK98_10085 [Chromobacterium sp. LK11]|uniref:AMP-binding protein n=1 Tax=Chromobacterium sp. LK11 TaxID=1628212 RepID=UPI000652AB0B|nr:AMP-binding protein [Chromobacterium sp. LK11]KMN81965.1 hypothetical protein VK98_10085 [Chromobacterium sp. LK11]
MNAPLAPQTAPARQNAVLRECFELARAHPFYQALYRGVDCADSAPPLEKAALQTVLASFAPEREASGLYLVRSGGSTQAALIFPVDIAENLAQRQALADRLRADGVFGPASIALNLFGYANLYRTAAIVDDVLERCQATTLPMSAHAADADILAAARQFHPSHALGTPSRLALFAAHLEAAGERLEIPQLLYAGETLHASTLARLRAALGAGQVWSLYGGAETGIWAWSDASRRPGLFRVLPRVAAEILQPDAAGYGRIAVSNAWRRRFPVFRYCVGDIGRWVERDGERWLELRGRDGRSFRLNETTYELDDFARLSGAEQGFQIQLDLDAAGRERLTLLLAENLDAGAEAALRASLAALLGRPPDSDAFALKPAARAQWRLDPVTSKTPPIVDLRA